MEKRALIAIALSFAVFFGYTKAVEYFYPDYGKSSAPAPDKVSASVPSTSDAGIAAMTLTGAAAPAAPDQVVPIEAPGYEFIYSSNEAAFTEIRFTGYPDNTGGAYRFMKTASGRTGTGAIDSILVDADAVSNLSFTTTKDGRQIFSTADAGKIHVEKSWRFSETGFGHGLSVSITNRSEAPVRVRYRILTGSQPVSHNSIDEQYIEANWLTASKLQHIRRPGVGKPKTLGEPVIAASMKNRHFSSLFKPVETNGTFSAHVEAYSKKDFGSYLVRSEATLQPGETLRDAFVWYAGPNRVEDMTPYGLDRIVNFGKMDIIAKILLGGLHMIAGVVKNYGVAIILLTILTNALMMPLTKTSFMSMRRMQLVQPETLKLREKHKDNPAKLNEATMALYKKHKVNPMGGCLPMLLQMPIFMGLYVALSKAPELLGARFLWAKDLASPDRVPLPFTLPLIGDGIHLLPLIMVGAMVAQQKMTAGAMGSMDPAMAQQQKIMMTVMPVIFGFIFYQMPSGLVIYWLTNTLVMTAYQAYLKKANPVLTPA